MASRTLPKHSFNLLGGLTSNIEQRSVAGQGFITGKNVDNFDKFRAIGKTPGNSRVSPLIPSTVIDFFHFEFTDLDLTRKRHQLLAAGTKLYHLENTTTATEIYDGLDVTTADLVSTTLKNRLYITGPQQVGLDTGGLKWDGSNVRNWGILAPGLEKTVVDAVDSVVGWVAGTDSTIVTDVNVKRFGTGSVALRKSGSSGTSASTSKASVAYNFTTDGSTQAFVWLFVPSGGLQVLATSGTAIEVEFSEQPSGDYQRHNFQVGELLPGWNLLSMVTSSPDASSGTLDLADVNTVKFTVNYLSTAAQNSLHFRFDELYTVDLGSPTVALFTDEDFDTVGDWATNGSNSLSQETTFKTEGTGSVELNKSDTSVTTGDISRSSGLSITTTGKSTISIDVFVPTGAKAKFATTAAGKLTLGSASFTNSADYNFDLDGSTITENAWNTLTATLASPDATTGTGLPATVAAVRFRFTMAATSNVEANLRVDNLRFPESPNGTFSYRVTYLTESGVESNAGPSSASIVATDQKISLSAIPVATDPQVIARRIYKDTGGDELYRFVAELSDNVTTTYTDNLPNASIGSVTPPLAGDDLKDNTPPDRMNDVTVFANRIIGISSEDPTTLIVTDPGAPEAARITEQLQVEEILVALRTHAFGLLVYGTDKVFLLVGDGVNLPFRLEEISNQIGANGFRSVERIKGLNLVLHEDEVYLVSDPRDPWMINAPVYDQFKARSRTTLENAIVVHDRARFRVVFFLDGKVLMYQYGVSASVEISGRELLRAAPLAWDPQDLRIGGWYEVALPSGLTAVTSAKIVERDADVPELWFSVGQYVYRLGDPNTTNWDVATVATAIDAEFETAAVPLGSQIEGRGEPRYLTVQGEASVATVWTATVSLLSDADGDAIANVSFSVTLGPNETSAMVPIPNVGRGEWARVKMRNNTLGQTGIIKSIDLHYIPRVDHRGPRAS